MLEMCVSNWSEKSSFVYFEGVWRLWAAPAIKELIFFFLYNSSILFTVQEAILPKLLSFSISRQTGVFELSILAWSEAQMKKVFVTMYH